MAKSSIFESERDELIFNLADSRTNNKGYFRNLHVIFKFDIGISEKENIVRKHIILKKKLLNKWKNHPTYRWDGRIFLGVAPSDEDIYILLFLLKNIKAINRILYLYCELILLKVFLSQQSLIHFGSIFHNYVLFTPSYLETSVEKNIKSYYVILISTNIM